MLIFTFSSRKVLIKILSQFELAVLA